MRVFPGEVYCHLPSGQSTDEWLGYNGVAKKTWLKSQNYIIICYHTSFGIYYDNILNYDNIHHSDLEYHTISWNFGNSHVFQNWMRGQVVGDPNSCNIHFNIFQPTQILSQVGPFGFFFTRKAIILADIASAFETATIHLVTRSYYCYSMLSVWSIMIVDDQSLKP